MGAKYGCKQPRSAAAEAGVECGVAREASIRALVLGGADILRARHVVRFGNALWFPELARALAYPGARIGTAEVAWVGRWNVFQIASMRAIVSLSAQRRSVMTQLLRFMRPAMCTASKR